MSKRASLPLIDALFKKIGQSSDLLTGWRCIYVQHLLRSNIGCLEFLEKLGISRADVAVFGKAYSTSRAVITDLTAEGWAVWEPTNYAYERPIDEIIIGQIVDWLRFDSELDRPLLVIDEGGLVSRALNNTGYQCARIAIVELTSRGAQHYELLDSKFPIIDVARSNIKKQVESSYIAQSMVEGIRRVLPDILSSYSKSRIGLVGGGAVGSALVRNVEDSGPKIEIFDVIETVRTSATLLDLINSCDVIMSSTGGGVDWTLPLSNEVGIKHLINCGSSDVEFLPSKLRDYTISRGGRFEVGNPAEPWRCEIKISLPGTELVLLNGGFPINFDGSEDPIPASIIQLTRTILMAGAVQAVLAKSCGVIPLNPNIQDWILSRYEIELVKDNNKSA